MKNCAICGQPFEPHTTQKYCSPECKQEAANRRARESTKATKKKRSKPRCVVCGKEISWAVKKTAKYCSTECKSKANKKRPKPQPQLEKRACANCGKEFTPKRADNIYCSAYCLQDAQIKRGKARKVVSGPNRPFTPDTAYIIRLWRLKGDSDEEIALALGRNIKQIKAVK